MDAFWGGKDLSEHDSCDFLPSRNVLMFETVYRLPHFLLSFVHFPKATSFARIYNSIVGLAHPAQTDCVPAYQPCLLIFRTLSHSFKKPARNVTLHLLLRIIFFICPFLT
jgi:hypothetical protein